jgi:MoxR-like ATPase
MDRIDRILANVAKVIIGKNTVTEYVLAGILCGGHILIEDVPGVGKTTLANTLARSLGCTFSRIQFTPDLMPSDIVGISVYDKTMDAFVFRPGPIMNQLILADEINRTSPRTQSSLLEAMSEGQISVDGTTYPLPSPFIVLATQNPIDYEGTYPLPEAQLDRFMLRVTMGYPTFSDETSIVSRPGGESMIRDVVPVTNPEELIEMRAAVEKIHFSRELVEYVVNLTQATREHPDITLGVSPRGGQHLFRGAQGLAYVRKRPHVLPDDIKAMIASVFYHRLILKPEALLRGKTPLDVINDVVNKTHVPVIRHADK